MGAADSALRSLRPPRRLGGRLSGGGHIPSQDASDIISSVPVPAALDVAMVVGWGRASYLYLSLVGFRTVDQCIHLNMIPSECRPVAPLRANAAGVEISVQVLDVEPVQPTASEHRKFPASASPTGGACG